MGSVKTWTLLLWLGFTPPVQIDDFTSYDDCKAAGEHNIKIERCKTYEYWANRKCAFDCLQGPELKQCVTGRSSSSR